MISHVISPSVKFKVPHALLLAFVLGFDAQTGPAAPQSDKPDLIQTFPVGRFDVFNQQVDLRTKNSWNMKLHEVC